MRMNIEQTLKILRAPDDPEAPRHALALAAILEQSQLLRAVESTISISASVHWGVVICSTTYD